MIRNPYHDPQQHKKVEYNMKYYIQNSSGEVGVIYPTVQSALKDISLVSGRAVHEFVATRGNSNEWYVYRDRRATDIDCVGVSSVAVVLPYHDESNNKIRKISDLDDGRLWDEW